MIKNKLKKILNTVFGVLECILFSSNSSSKTVNKENPLNPHLPNEINLPKTFIWLILKVQYNFVNESTGIYTQDLDRIPKVGVKVIYSSKMETTDDGVYVMPWTKCRTIAKWSIFYLQNVLGERKKTPHWGGPDFF